MIYEVLLKAIPDFRIEIEDIIANGDYVATRWNVQGVHNDELFGVLPSGKKIEFSGMSWMRIVDGKIVENWNNASMSYLLLATACGNQNVAGDLTSVFFL